MSAEPSSIDTSPRGAAVASPGLEAGLAGADREQLIELARRLSAERERMADFARASGDWLWETDASLRLTWLSDSFEAATGLDRQAFLGRSLVDGAPWTAAAAADDAATSALRTLLAGRAAFSRAIATLQTPHGPIEVSHSAVPIVDAQQRFAGYRGTARDVTAQQDAERRLREQALLLRQSDDRWDMAAAATGIGIAQVDLATGAMELDERACVNHGLAYPATGYSLPAWLAAVNPEDRADVQATIEAAIARCDRFDARMRSRGDDGIERTLEIIAHAVAGADGRATGIVGTCRDVTQQVAHEQLLRDKESAVRANRAKSQFLSRVSHELRTPLNGILGFAQLMALDRVHPLAPDQQRRLDSVERAGRHLLGLINDVLDLARIEQEDFSVRLEPVDLGVALDACLGLIAPLAREAQVSLPEAPPTACWVLADQRALEQVLMNLLSNAIKYNRSGGRVGIVLGRAGDRVQLAIRDEGAGLTEAQQARLFQHFDRLGAESGRVEGTGLGLVISLQLVHAMGGELRVRSEPGAGSTFTVELPAAAAPAQPSTAAVPQGAPAPTAASAPRSVLYIEDERLNVVLMEEVFRTRPQWRLDIAEDGAEGLRQALALRPDLLLIDMNLPDMNGLALIRALRTNPATSGLRCIALSADAMSEQVAAALAAGFDAYWTKPIDVPRMLADLARQLG